MAGQYYVPLSIVHGITNTTHHRSTRRRRTVIERETDSSSHPLIRILGCWTFGRRKTSVIEVLRMRCNTVCGHSKLSECGSTLLSSHPPTFLDSVPKSDSSPNPPACALLVATPYTPSCRPPRALRARVSPRVYKPHLPLHPDASIGYHAVDSEGEPDAGERKAEVSRGLATDGAMRDDSHCLSLFSGSDVT